MAGRPAACLSGLCSAPACCCLWLQYGAAAAVDGCMTQGWPRPPAVGGVRGPRLGCAGKRPGPLCAPVKGGCDRLAEMMAGLFLGATGAAGESMGWPRRDCEARIAAHSAGSGSHCLPLPGLPAAPPPLVAVTQERLAAAEQKREQALGEVRHKAERRHARIQLVIEQVGGSAFAYWGVVSVSCGVAGGAAPRPHPAGAGAGGCRWACCWNGG